MTDFKLGRRGFLQAMAAMASYSPEKALARLAAFENPYPWITDPKVHAAMVELVKMQDPVALELRASSTLNEFIRAISPDMRIKQRIVLSNAAMDEICDNHPIFIAMRQPRSKQTIDTILRHAETIYKQEAAKEPRMQELRTFIFEQTGETADLLGLPPELANAIKQLLQFVENAGGKSRFAGQGFGNLESSIQLLREYRKAYVSGTLDEFRAEHSSLEKPMGDIKGEDYEPSHKENALNTKGLVHLLNLPATRIESTLGKGPMAYRATIHSRHDVRGNIDILAHKLFPERKAPLMQISETNNALPIQDSRGFLTVTDPPRDFMEMIEAAKEKKIQLSR